ncbi:hypothetical protein [Microbacterium arabinogalactanolyticum]|uniref:hypothetical protein n=1 Tax=Microbacterium arabinogalactanolyticum TaxID=69365 RepID=UPI00255271C3|nr:hypothetical protein [Microbacterium arabinogalactanolyticum]
MVGYLALPFTGLLSPLIALPAVTFKYGAAAWAAIAIGQSIGMAASAIGELGWGLNGPQRVARAAAGNSYQILVLSIQSKLVVFAPLAVIVAVSAYTLSPEYRSESAVIAIASLAAGLNAVWFYLGKSRPWVAIVTDGLPRMIGVLVAAGLLLVGAPLMVYALVGLLLPCVVGPVLGLLVARTGLTRPRVQHRPRQVISAIFAQSSAFTARLVSALYIALPVTLVSIVSPASVAVFAAGERLMRLGLGAMASVPNGMQGWVGSEPDRMRRWSRVRSAIFLNVLLGMVAAACFGFLAPVASSLMFSGSATIPSELAWVLALVIVIVSTSRATGNLALVALSRVRIIMWSAIAGAIVGVPSILVFSHLLGPIGGAIGELSAELVVLTVQIVGVVSTRRRQMLLHGRLGSA